MPEESTSPSSESCSAPIHSPQSDKPPTPPGGSQPAGPVRHGRARLKKILIPLVLFALGVLLGSVGYFWIYPSPETGIPTPSSSHITIDSSVHIQEVFVSIDEVGIGVSVLLPEVGASVPAAGSKEDITIELPIDADFSNCPDCVNHILGIPLGSFTTEKLIFTKKFSVPSEGLIFINAVVRFRVKPSDFGMSFDGINAYAAIPEIILTEPVKQGTSASIGFSIPSASSYDWSAFRPDKADNSNVTWVEQSNNGDFAGRTTVGINHAHEANDSTLSFLAGALIGLAGAAILSAAQEALHIFTDHSTTAGTER